MLEIEYKISRKPRRKILSISISTDNKITVKANNTISPRDIQSFVREKQLWIQKILKFNQTERKPFIPKRFISGEDFLILGKPHSLLIAKSSYCQVRLRNEILEAVIPDNFINKPDYIKNKLINWYKCSAYEIIFKQVNIYKQMLGVQVKEIMIRNLKRAWANCSSKGIVTFSWRLLMAPEEIIEYVVVHELAHLIHHNHSPKFWQTVEKIKPDYRRSKAWLKINENKLLW